MRYQRNLKFLKVLPGFFFLCFFYVVSFCQENSNPSIIGPPDEEEKWYAQPWIWIAGAILLILLLLAVLRRTKPTRSIADDEQISKVIGSENDSDIELNR